MKELELKKYGLKVSLSVCLSACKQGRGEGETAPYNTGGPGPRRAREGPWEIKKEKREKEEKAKKQKKEEKRKKKKKEKRRKKKRKKKMIENDRDRWSPFDLFSIISFIRIMGIGKLRFWLKM